MDKTGKGGEGSCAAVETINVAQFCRGTRLLTWPRRGDDKTDKGTHSSFEERKAKQKER